jgi:trans-2,3-dihydro-3-hydroxyanthranilate isomerase
MQAGSVLDSTSWPNQEVRARHGTSPSDWRTGLAFTMRPRYFAADTAAATNRLKYRYYICDVFTEMRFGGNQLAVLPETDGLSDHQMQQITREFNFSESAFVLPSKTGHTRHVRIFTPGGEIPFAGHPTVGTAFVLASAGELGEIGSSLTVTFEEEAGSVPVTIYCEQGAVVRCEVAAPQSLSLGKTIIAQLVADAVSLSPEDILTDTHHPQVCSVGLPFVITELKDRPALERARISMRGFDALANVDIKPSMHLYVRVSDGFDIRARMFAPLSGVPEDPATGSANCALGGLLAHYQEQASGTFSWRIAQGVEMGRPSTLLARAHKKDGAVQATWVGGSCVMVSEGFIQID